MFCTKKCDRDMIVQVGLSELFLLLMVYLAYVQLQLASSAHSVGKICDADDQCMANEFCYLSDNTTIPPCTFGKCHCLPGYEVQKDCSLNDTCLPIQRYLGDDCCLWVLPSLPLGTRCSERDHGRVECNSPAFRQDGNTCVSSTSHMTPFMSCKQPDECDGGLMTCGPNYRCECPFNLPIYDQERQHCTTRIYGDSCSSDSMCNGQGYTSNLGSCSPNGTCACVSNTETVVSYLDRKTGHVVNKTICLPTNAVKNGGIGSPCHLNPILQNSSIIVWVCAPGLVCRQCPEEKNLTFGTCRLIVPPARSLIPPSNVSHAEIRLENFTNLTTTTTTVGDNLLSTSISSSGWNETTPSNDNLNFPINSSMLITTPEYNNSRNLSMDYQKSAITQMPENSPLKHNKASSLFDCGLLLILFLSEIAGCSFCHVLCS